MAQGAQGVALRVVTATVLGNSDKGYDFATGSTGKVFATVAGNDMVSSGIATGMRIKVTSTHPTDTNGYHNLYTVKDAAATMLNLHEPLATSINATSIRFSAYTFSCIGEVVGFTGPAETVAVVDITNLQSNAKEKISVGARDGGQVSLDINFDIQATSLHRQIMGDMTSRTERYYDIVFSDKGAATVASYCAFKAIPSAWSIQGAVDNIVKASLTLDITGFVQYTTRT